MTLNNVSGMYNGVRVHKGFVSRRMLYVLQAITIMILLGGCFGGYRWYCSFREQAAQKRFSDGVKEYNNTLSGQLGHQNWAMIAEVFGLGAREYSGTSLAPFYLAYQAQALLKDNKLTEAASVMDHAVGLMSPENELYFEYALKNVLMQMDVVETAGGTTDDTEKKLVDLADNAKNKQRDAALFYLGRYYLSKNNDARAKEVLQKLVTEFGTVPSDKEVGVALFGKEADTASPWAQEADKLLKQVVV